MDGPRRMGSPQCIDAWDECPGWVEGGACLSDPSFMLLDCMESCGLCEALSLVAAEERDPSSCVNEHPKCEEWAEEGECAKNPKYMLFSCPISCGSCHLQDPKVRCRRYPGTHPSLAPGDIDRVFGAASESSEFAHLRPRVLSRDPWVIVFDSFLSDEEVDSLLEQGGKEWVQSTDTGDMLPNGTFTSVVSSARTSSTAWCNVPECYNDPVVEDIIGKISAVTQIPETNSEHIQVLRYEATQRYVDHHDYTQLQRDLPCGPRVFTLYMYLSDVEEGGGTGFTRLGLTVQPKKGRAILWPSVRNEDPMEMDERTHHEALPVVRGVKYGANAWLHLYDFQSAMRVHCTGSQRG